MRSTRRMMANLATLTLLGLVLPVVSPARAQDWPTKPIKVIVPFAAGGGTDFIARLMAQHLTTRLGQPVYVENRGGANGAIGLQALKQSDPDGYTIAATSDTPLVVNPSLMARLPYTPLEDFIPVASMVRFPSLIAATPSLKVHSLPELIALAKAKPGSITYGSAGIGNFSHLSMELFAMQAGLKLLHVPYRGAGPASVALLAGEVDIGINNVQVTLQNIRAGKLIALAVGEPERMAVLPDVPTIAETLPGFRVTSWAGIVAPAKTPKAIVERLNKEITAVMADPEVVKLLEAQQITPFSLDQAAFTDLVKSDSEKWSAFLKRANISID